MFGFGSKRGSLLDEMGTGVDLFDAVDILESIRLKDIEARVEFLAKAPSVASMILPRG